MADQKPASVATSASTGFPIFIETKLGSKLVIVVSSDDTVIDLKKKIETEHVLAFPDIGEINVHAIEVQWVGSSYRLSDCMLVWKAFEGNDGIRFLYVDATIKNASTDVQLEKGVVGTNIQIRTDLLTFEGPDNTRDDIHEYVPREFKGQDMCSPHCSNVKRRNESESANDDQVELPIRKKRHKKKKEKELMNEYTTESKDAVYDATHKSELHDNDYVECIGAEKKRRKKLKEKTTVNNCIMKEKETEANDTCYKPNFGENFHERTLEKGGETFLGSTNDQLLNPNELPESNFTKSKKRMKKSSKSHSEAVEAASLQINKISQSLAKGKSNEDIGKVTENEIRDTVIHGTDGESSDHLKESNQLSSAMQYRLCQTETAIASLEKIENIHQKPSEHASENPAQKVATEPVTEDAEQNEICRDIVKEDLKVSPNKTTQMSGPEASAFESHYSLPQHVAEKVPGESHNHHISKKKKKKKKSLKPHCEPVVSSSKETGPPLSKGVCSGEVESSDPSQSKSDVAVLAGKQMEHDDVGKFSENKIGCTELHAANETSDHLKQSTKSRSALFYGSCLSETDVGALEDVEHIHQEPSKHTSETPTETVAMELVSEDAGHIERCGNMVNVGLKVSFDRTTQLFDSEVAAFESLNSLPHVSEENPGISHGHHNSKKRKKKSLKSHCESDISSLEIKEISSNVVKGMCNGEAGPFGYKNGAALEAEKEVDDGYTRKIIENGNRDTELCGDNDESSHRLKESNKSRLASPYSLCQNETALGALEKIESICLEPSNHASEISTEKLAVELVPEDADQNEACGNILKASLKVPSGETTELSDPAGTAFESLGSFPQHVTEKNSEQSHDHDMDLAEKSGGQVIIQKATDPGIILEDVPKSETDHNRSTRHSKKKSEKTSKKPRNKGTTMSEHVSSSQQLTVNFSKDVCDKQTNGEIHHLDLNTREAETNETMNKTEYETRESNIIPHSSPFCAVKGNDLIDKKSDRKKSLILSKEPSSNKVQTRNSHSKNCKQKQEVGVVISDLGSPKALQDNKHIKLPHDAKRKTSLKSSNIEATIDSKVKSSRSKTQRGSYDTAVGDSASTHAKRFDGPLAPSSEDSPACKIEHYRVAVRKVPGRKLEKISNNTKQTSVDRIFDDVSSAGSEDDPEFNDGKPTLKHRYDDSNTSSESNGEVEGTQMTHARTQVLMGNQGAHVSAAYNDIGVEIDGNGTIGPEQNKSKLKFGAILRNSSSYKKAKLSQSQNEDEESEPIDFVQETQPELY